MTGRCRARGVGHPSFSSWVSVVTRRAGEVRRTRRSRSCDGGVESGSACRPGPGRGPTSAASASVGPVPRARVADGDRPGRLPAGRRSSVAWAGAFRESQVRAARPACDGAGSTRGRVGAGRGRRDVAGAAPQRGGQVRAGGVGGADEHHPAGGHAPPVWAATDRAASGHQLQVGAPAVALGRGAGDEPGLLQHVQVVGQQVDGMPARGQLGRGARHRWPAGR